MDELHTTKPLEAIRALSLALVIGVLPIATAAAESVLVVEQINGDVQIDHLGETRALQVGTELQERDVVRVGDKAYLSLRFTQEGALELGPGAALAIERLPETERSPDLRSIFSLWQGYMHIVWKHPRDTRWPLFVYFGGQRSSLVDGEYFFERLGNRNRSCVAAGRMAVTAISGDGLGTLQPSACYDVRPGVEPKPVLRPLDGWVNVRQAFMLDPDPAHPVRPFPPRVPETVDPVVAQASAAVPLPGPSPQIAAAAPSPAAAVVAPPVAPRPVPAAPAAPSASAAVPSSTPPAPAPSPAASAIIFTDRQKAAVNKPTAPATAPPTPAPAGAAPPSSVTAPVAEAPDSNAGWTILIGSYADPANATQIQQKLASIGLTPFLRVKLVDGKVWNSVQVRGFISREQAEARMNDVAAKLGLPNLRVVQLQ